MNSQFNAIDYAQQLEAAGVPQAQAEVHAKLLSQALTNCAATRADLAALDERLSTRLTAFEVRINARMDAFEASVIARMDAFEASVIARMDAFEASAIARMDAFEARAIARMDAFEARVDLQLAKMRAELQFEKWMIGVNAALTIAVLVKLYFP
jgi:hypothetical protein